MIKKWLLNNISLHTNDNKNEEIVNALTHFIGFILSVVGFVLILFKNTETLNLKLGLIIYLFTMMILFFSSAIYHWVKGPIIKRIGRILDHCNIYFLIAGTYTPISIYIGGNIGSKILYLEWILTFIGIVFTLRFWGRFGFIHVMFYIVMGWMIIFLWPSFVRSVPENLPPIIMIGGILYTIGTIFYAIKKLPYYHGIWHLFVVLGAGTMFIGIYRYLV